MVIDSWKYQTTGRYITLYLEEHHAVLFYFVAERN